MPTYNHGRHEHGQNSLTNRRVFDSLIARVETTTDPIVEIGPGEGALTHPLAYLGRPLTAVEIDGCLVDKLRGELPPATAVIHEDFLRYRLPSHARVIVGNIPFHITTAILRHLLRAPKWTDAVLIMQWEPWFEFELGDRIPRAAFTPRPNVDGGVLHIRRRPQPLVEVQRRKEFHAMVHAIYTGRGRGIVEIISRQRILPTKQAAQLWAQRSGVRNNALPSDLTVYHFVSLFESSGTAPPRARLMKK